MSEINSDRAKVAAMDKANWKPSVQYWRERAEAAEVEVSNLKNWIDHNATEAPRLQAEVERQRKIILQLSTERHVSAMRVADKMHKQQAQATDDYMALLEQLKTARNDALEEAAYNVAELAEHDAEERDWKDGARQARNISAAIRALKETK